MDSFVAGRDLSDDLRKFSNRCSLPAFLHSDELKNWWSKVQESSSFIIEKQLSWNDWKFMIKVLAQLDVSRIEHLVLELPEPDFHAEVETISGPVVETGDQNRQLGSMLSPGRFSALKTLRILSSVPKFVRGQQIIGCQQVIDSIVSALSGAQFTHLRTLSLPTCNDSAIKVLGEVGFPGLMSLSIRDSYRSNGFVWPPLVEAIKSGKLPKMTSLDLGENMLIGDNLADLVAGSENWFSSLENLSLDSCYINSDEMCSLVDAVMRLRGTTQKLALKTLDLHDNQLDTRAVDALVDLAHSNRLPQLRQLDLSGNWRLRWVGSKSLLSLVETIQRGCLPRLQKLQWRRNEVDDESAGAIVQAYFENQALTTEIDIDWTQVSDLSLKTKLKTYRDRNVRLVAMREKLNQNEDLGDYLPLTYAKVFLCGYQEVGKTRLRRTLLRHLGIRSKFVWETFPNIFNDTRTRGIEISKIQEEKGSNGQNTTLVLWDLAGQEEYHVLHGSFLADLGFEGGKATTFVLVFKAPFERAVEDKLLYWLRIVASCSFPLVKRHVVIVLNCFNGKICTEIDQSLWKALIGEYARRFNDVLHIRTHPFIMDVRKAASVKPLKDHLFDHAQTLGDVGVPRACFELQQGLKGWSEVANHNHLPILTWQAFEEAWKLKPTGNHFSAKALKIAASYLHEIGEIIYFEDKEPTMPGSKYRSILVPDPEWFCRKVVGELLLPEQILKGGSSIKASADGSISLVLFQAFFEHLLVEGTQTDDIISMLELVGLCYRRDKEKIFIPALIREDDYNSIDWESKRFTTAMGRCLATEDRGRNAIPMTLFRRLQVELAQDQNLGGRGDSECRVGKSFLSFKFSKLFVLIQFDVDQSDPIDDRIDILVKSRTGGNLTDMRSAQVKCICEIMQKVEDLCVGCCPGLRYDIKVVKPSGAADRSDKMRERDVNMSLREIKHLLVKGEEYSSWQQDGDSLQLKSFLSEGELRGVVGLVEREYDECKLDTMTMGLLTEDSLQEIEANEDKGSDNPSCADIQSKSLSCERDDEKGLTEKNFQQGMQKLEARLEAVVRREGHDTRRHIDKKSTELLSEFRHKQEVLVKIIQAQQSFFIEEEAGSVPRYIFLSRKQGQSDVWISLREAFKSTFELHMLCESHFEDGFVHEVEGQEGIQLTKTKEWLVKLSPWLRRSLQVAVIVGKTVGNVHLPGVFSFLPDYSSLLQGEVLAKAVDSAATMIVEEDEAVTQVRDGEGNCGTAAEPINLKERLIAQGVLKDLIREEGHGVFARKIGLRKVVLRATDQPHVGSSRQPQPSVLWICDVCYRNYDRMGRFVDSISKTYPHAKQVGIEGRKD